jgi:hypothetical protein
MNMQLKSSRIRLALGLALGISGLLYAAAVFLPSTQPTVTLGQYVLQNRDLLSDSTIAYRPWFENGAWQGDIIEYFIDQYGNRTTSAPVGLSCVDTASCDTLYTYGSNSISQAGQSVRQNWMARATYRARGADDPNGTYWQDRNIFTYNSEAVDFSNTNGQVEFTWDQLSTTQRAAIDIDTYNTILAAADDTLNTATASDILNYVRGHRLHEKQHDTETGSSGDLRTRYSVLGDVTNTPEYIAPPRELLREVTGYTAFQTAQASRPGRLAFGANDGMLHVLDAADGTELYAYVPSMVFDRLHNLAARDEAYTHTYYVDGELTSASVQIGADTPVWHTILTGGCGAGCEGLFALDMTSADYSSDKLLFEKTGGNWGHIYGKPAVGFIGAGNADPTWYIFTGNGYKTTAGQPTRLMMINLDTRAVTEIDTGATGGLSAPALLSLDDDLTVELAFAGDIKGDLWMFVIDDTDPANPSATAVKVFDGSADQPISNAPTIARHPSEDGYMVYFGTGSIFSSSDALNDGLRPGGDPDNPSDYTRKQAVYGIWVDTSNLGTLITSLTSQPYTASNLRSQTVARTTYKFSQAEDPQSVRYVPNPNTVYYTCPYGVEICPTLSKGWYLNFPSCGERLVGSPFVRAGRVQFVTTNPTGTDCGGLLTVGNSWAMSLDYVQGTDNGKIVYNLDGDEILDSGDEILFNDGSHFPPVGLNLGEGNISQPTFARLRAGVDKMFINGLQLPVPEVSPPADILAGHIDVVIDSPSNGIISINDISKHSEGYNNQTQGNDGLGRAVDGLVHDYDGLHHVDYVDFFTLEPRRGLGSLLAGSSVTPLEDDEDCSEEIGSKEVTITVDGEEFCIPATEGELNRAYDVLHTDGDGAVEPLEGTDAGGAPAPVMQSEVNSLNDSAAIAAFTAAPDKSFIITLANADLSKAGWLQIGCRVWPVVQYQNMIKAKVASGTSPATWVDNYGGSLVFTLQGIYNDSTYTCPGDENHALFRTEVDAIEVGLSTTPTLRIGFGARGILDTSIHPTRPQCVMGLHDPQDKVCFSDEVVLSATESALTTGVNAGYDYDSCTAGQLFDGVTGEMSVNLASNGTTVKFPHDYVRDPDRQLHITKANSSEFKGNFNYYRWRNGALTMQLIDSGIDPATDLQSPDTMVPSAGTHAQAYTLDRVGGDIVVNATSADETAAESGLLYEAAIFWHYSALVDKVRNSDPENNLTPPEAECYGSGSYSGSVVIEVGGLTLGEYQALTNPLVAQCAEAEATVAAGGEAVCFINRYFQLLEIIENPSSENDLNKALVELSALLALSPELQAYVDLREYVGDKIPEQHKLEGDKVQGDDDLLLTDPSDGTPAKVTTIETIDLEARGPNYVFGRRNWIDIKQ